MPKLTLVRPGLATTTLESPGSGISSAARVWTRFPALECLRGDMAFVGPRPERPEFVEKLGQEIPSTTFAMLARPGITGWAQINYGYGSSVEEAKEKLRYDLYYIRNVSVILDLIIVFRTFRAVLLGRGVR